MKKGVQVFDEKIAAGIDALLDSYIGIRESDKIYIGYTPESRESAAWVAAILQSRGMVSEFLWMLPLRDDGFFDRLCSALPNTLPPDGRLVFLTFEQDTMSHTDAVRRALVKFAPQQSMVFRAIGAGRDLFAQSLLPTPLELTQRNSALLERLSAGSRLRIMTKAGTDLVATIDNSRFRWISNRGVWRPGSFVILPAGEVATFPVDINGILVADFAFHINSITDLDVRLERHPVRIDVVDGIARHLECENKEIEEFLLKEMSVEHGRRVGELGFGTNFGVRVAVRNNSHVNERVPGIHLGFGQHNQGDDGGYICPLHVDFIARGATIWVDGGDIPLDLENVQFNGEAHPRKYFEEDVLAPNSKDIYQDCCGIHQCDT